MDHGENKGVPAKHLLLQAFDFVDHNKLWKLLKEMGVLVPYLSPEKPIWRMKQQLESEMGQWTGSNLVKECDKAVYCHLAYLIEYIM